MNISVTERLKKGFEEKFNDRPHILGDILDVMDDVFNGDIHPVARYETPNDLLKNMSMAFEMPISKIIDRKRKRLQVSARQYFCYQCKLIFGTKYTLSQIGEVLGGYDHSSVIHCIQQCRDRLEIKDEATMNLHNIWINYNL